MGEALSTKDKILKQLAENPVIIYMKGSPSAPECGFSAKAVEVLNGTKIPYAYVDVLRAPFIREKLPSVSKWPTFPQLFVKGELIGGSDIIEAMDRDGGLLPLLQAAVPVTEADSATVSHSEVSDLVRGALPDAEVAIIGEGCNLELIVVSDAFEGLSLVKQHQLVLDALAAPLASGRLHAVTLKTHTVRQRQESQAGGAGLLQIQL